MNKRLQGIDAILSYRFPAWLLAAVLVVLIVGVRILFG
jgi:hypothetical protein